MILTPTEIEELNIAIAEECGWKRRMHGAYSKNGDILHIQELPRYTERLDIIQKAAMEQFKDRESAICFEIELLSPDLACGTKSVWQLTAIDWCIAFARTAKIWRWK